MEFYYYSPSETFVVLTADQFVGHDDGLLEQQRQDIHVCSESLYGGQFTLSTQLIKPNYLVIHPPTQHHSFFRNLPPLFIKGKTVCFAIN